MAPRGERGMGLLAHGGGQAAGCGARFFTPLAALDIVVFAAFLAPGAAARASSAFGIAGHHASVRASIASHMASNQRGCSDAVLGRKVLRNNSDSRRRLLSWGLVSSHAWKAGLLGCLGLLPSMPRPPRLTWALAVRTP